MPEKTKYSLLVVDDEEGPRTSIRMVFKNDFNVHTFADGDQALAFARQNPVHLAILDIRMAGKSGIEVLQGLKEIDPHVEVIMLTAYETLDTAKQALRLGASDYLNKPFDLATIREAVGRALRLRQISENISGNADRLRAVTEQLQDAFSREEMSRAATEIYAGVIHDLNNPLTIISGFVDLLQNRLKSLGELSGQDLESVRASVATISRQVNTCCAIANRYLRVIRRMSGDAEGVSVNQVLGDLEALVRNHPALAENQLEVTPLPEDATAAINGTDLIQILLNLVINALQSTERVQTVRVSAVMHTDARPLATFTNRPDEIYVGLESFANTPPLVAVTVTDEGSGIPPDVLPRIVEAYFTTKQPGKGTGLGLSIVTRLIKAGRGYLHVRTRPGAGTSMTVCLPAQPAATSSGAPASPAS